MNWNRCFSIFQVCHAKQETMFLSLNLLYKIKKNLHHKVLWILLKVPTTDVKSHPFPVNMKLSYTWIFAFILYSVQSLSHVQLFVTRWTAALQASLSLTNSQSLLKLMSIRSVMPSNHLILCRPLLIPRSIFTSIRVFSNKSVLQIRWPKYWSFSFNTMINSKSTSWGHSEDQMTSST